MAVATQVPGAASRLPSLTGLRFVAAFAVFLGHGFSAVKLFEGPVAATMDKVTHVGGPIGVSFFFLLSGFVLAWSAGSRKRPDTTGGFLRRRVAKIYPNHLATLLATVALTFLMVGQLPEWRYALPNLALVQAWFPDIRTVLSINLVSWSLSCELFFYLCFPLVYRWIRRIPADRLWYWVVGLAGAVVAVPFVAATMPPGEMVPYPLIPTWFVFYFPPVRLLEFVLGVLVARTVAEGRWVRLGVGPAAVLAAAAFATAPHVMPLYNKAALTVVPLTLLIAAVALRDVRDETTGRPTGWLASRPLVWLGEVSFAFYLVHYALLAQSPAWLGLTLPLSTELAFALVAGAFVASLLLSWLLFRLVEEPAMRRFGRPRRRPVRPSVEAPRSERESAAVPS